MSIPNGIANFIDTIFFKPVFRLFYPNFENLYPNKVFYYQLFKRYFIPQKIFRINGRVPWPVDFRSQVIDWKNIDKDKSSYPGGSMGCYISASGGLKLGSRVIIGPNTIISTTNHSSKDFSEYAETKGVTIGNNVWIGANCSIVAGTQIGDNVTIGANCYIKGIIPPNSIVTQNESNLNIKEKRQG